MTATIRITSLISLFQPMIPFLSIVMPVFNAINFVHRAIDSVLAQSFRDWELLPFDDGSTDGSPVLLESRRAGLSADSLVPP